ncbi:hypothetical protein BGX38DRAFT_1089637 [Terfezia claveryi]|nr:hypothetical protein BGX38DRAFT_1089637 [Terfezia claveryi]
MLDPPQPPKTPDDHAQKPFAVESLLTPHSPTSGIGIPARRFSTVSASGPRRRGPSNTVKNSKYVTLIPGSEPGLSPDSKVELHTRCGITVVDFSQDQVIQTELENDSLREFLEEDRPEWSLVRWINLNGLSWDCISAVAKKYKLHSLALEDLLNTKNRTKCDWYSDHAFINLTMLKLVHATECNPAEKPLGRPPTFLQRIFRRHQKAESGAVILPVTATVDSANGCTNQPLQREYKSLQHYYGGAANAERVAFMEKHSPLAAKKMLVSVEQVSIFLTSCNTVISFFENSADDVEPPILERLGSEHTVLRSSCDASMVVQGIVDAIIDLAFPVIHAYQDVMADLEVSVITSPDIQHTGALYILTSELSLLKQTIAPVVGLINSLKGHKLDPNRKLPGGALYGVEISEMGKTYLTDVEDHCVMMMERLDTMKRGADNMIDLIFNTIGSLQNESMKKLTLVTILFLPLTFLTGYFGMNFEIMDSVQTHSEAYFWKIAIPLAFFTALWLLGKTLFRKLGIKFNQRSYKKQKEERKRAEVKFGKGGLQKRETFREG